MKFAITLTASKVMAFLILGCAVYLERKGVTGVFMFAVPFVSALIVGKQYFDRNKGVEEPKP